LILVLILILILILILVLVLLIQQVLFGPLLLSLDGGGGCPHIIRDDVASVEEAAGHVQVVLHHWVGQLEPGIGGLQEMDSGAGHQVGLNIGQVHIDGQHVEPYGSGAGSALELEQHWRWSGAETALEQHWGWSGAGAETALGRHWRWSGAGAATETALERHWRWNGAGAGAETALERHWRWSDAGRRRQERCRQATPRWCWRRSGVGRQAGAAVGTGALLLGRQADGQLDRHPFLAEHGIVSLGGTCTCSQGLSVFLLVFILVFLLVFLD
jgi:hypothetical protein